MIEETDVSKKSYTLAEVGERWGISTSSVLSLVYSGDLRAVDVSTNPANRSRFIVLHADLLAFEQSRKNEPPETAPRETCDTSYALSPEARKVADIWEQLQPRFKREIHLWITRQIIEMTKQ